MHNLVRLTEAQKYEPPLHDATVHCMHLQHNLTGSQAPFSVGVSYYLPGARAEMSASPLGRVYVVLDGELTVEFADEAVKLGTLDSLYIGPNERREARNVTNKVVTILVTMPYPAPSPVNG